MMLEGLTLLIKTTDSSLEYANISVRKMQLIRLVIGWGLPCIIVGISISIGFMNGDYMNSDPEYPMVFAACWLSSKFILYSVLLPVAIILAINCITLIKVAHFVCKMKSEIKQLQVSTKLKINNLINVNEITATMKALLTLFPVLGIPWVISIFVGVGPHSSSVPLLYLNVVINGLQGLLLFLLYCVNSGEVRRLIINRLKRGPLHSQTSVGSNNATTSSSVQNITNR
uniref:G-protein coupled receptors family 2 profile 2 domain-containing protein n=1 Tax=Ciona savignyi TaxID=51511 RepID=H2ZHB9_CIOSA